jgi:hypothetical protein
MCRLSKGKMLETVEMYVQN